MIKPSIGLLAAFAFSPLVCSAAKVTPLHDGWKLQSACKINADGAAISADRFSTDGWLATTVPSTALAA